MASRSRLSQAALDALRTEWRAAPRGAKTEVVQRAAQLYGVAPATLYRALNQAGHRGPKRQREPQKPHYRDWAAVLNQLINKGPKHQIPTEAALEAAVAGGLLPPEAADVHLSTYNRLIRELGGRDQKRKVNRIWSREAMRAVEIDGSTSEYFSVVRQLDDGDYLLKINRRVHQVYKNKPLGKERLRLQLYSIWEMHSGYQLSRYVAAKGENAFDAMEFFIWTASEKDDPRIPYHGLPQDLWADQGPVTKLTATRDLLDRLDVNLVTGEAYEKERQGGVEQTHAKRWRGFEATFFMLLDQQTKGLEIRLSELNRRLLNWCIRINNRPARYQPALSKRDAWVRSVNRQGGVRRLPERAMETLATEVRRFVDQSGVAQWDNEFYAVPRIHSRWVVLRRSLTDRDRVIAEDIETGERFEATRWTPPDYGEIRGRHTSGRDKAAAAGADLRVDQPLYGGDRAQDDTPAIQVVTRLPARTKEAQPLEDPLDAGHYPDLQSAMQAFLDIYGLDLGPQHRPMVEQALTDNGLSKHHVRELALRLRSITTTPAQRRAV